MDNKKTREENEFLILLIAFATFISLVIIGSSIRDKNKENQIYNESLYFNNNGVPF